MQSLPALHEPAPSSPLRAQARSRSRTDWARAAQLAANGVVGAEALARRQAAASGELPWSGPGSTTAKPRPSFPWSRQPLTSWFDFDPAKLQVTVKLGKRCVLAWVVLLPVIGFGCALGHIDPDPGRADLFDPKYRPVPLTLPEPALQSQTEPDPALASPTE